MKRLCLFISLILFVMIAVKTEAFIQSRNIWWKQRAHQLEEKQTLLEKCGSSCDAYRIVVEKDLSRARKMLAIFDGALKNDGSLTEDTTADNHCSIPDLVKDTVPPLFSVYYLSSVASRLGDWSAIDKTRDTVRHYLEEKIKLRFGREEKSMAEAIINEEIDANEWKNLSAEMFLGNVMIKREEALDSVMKEVTATAKKEFSGTKSSPTITSIRKFIIGSAINRCKDGILPVVKDGRTALEFSWTWKKIFRRIERNFKNYETILSLLGKDKNVSLERIRFFQRNPYALEAELFGDHMHGKYLYNKSFVSGKKYIAGHDQVILVIPQDMNCKAVLEKLDEFRKKGMEAVNGGEKGDFFSQLRKKGDGIISGHMGSARKIFKSETEREKKLKDKTGDEAVAIVNYKEFENAHETFKIKYRLAHRYKRKTIDFIRWLSDTKKLNEEEIADGYRYQLDRTKEYIEFILDLTRDCLDAAELDNTIVHGTFKSSGPRTEEVFNYFKYSLSIPDREKSALSSGSYKILMEEKENLAKFMTGAKLNVASCRKEYEKLRASAAVDKADGSELLRKRIAQEEVSLLFSSIDEYASLLDKYNYMDHIFNQYALLYGAMEAQAKDGSISDALTNIIESYSLLKSIKDFDEKKMADELELRKKLREEITLGIARLTVLLDFYKRRNILIEDRPDYEEIQALHKRAGKRVTINVDQWVMNENNYRIIDEKAAARLKQIAHRSLWLSSEKSQKNESSQKVVTMKLPEWKLTFALPHGWSEARNSKDETNQKSFMSMDKQSMVHIAGFMVTNKKQDEASDTWLKEGSSVKVKERWGTIHGAEYYWVLSKDKDQAVRETYAFTKNGAVLIISGRSRKDLYPLFRKKFRELIDSLSF